MNRAVAFVILLVPNFPALPAAAAEPAETALPAVDSPLGVGWAFVYGYQGISAEKFMPDVRQMGGGLAKIYVFWNQLEPDKGRYDWSAVDAFVDQLHSPDEGLITVFSSSTWATEQPSSMIPGSPPKNPNEYSEFIFKLVSRYKGRVRFWQNDSEPNNPIYWSGTQQQFVDELKLFHKAVKAADPAAIVVAGGYDGLFNPPGMWAMYNQQAGLDFFDHVLDAGRDAFDAFDLRLYADPYTIPGRVDFIRGKMRSLGYEKPIIATEYGGPGFFEFAANREYIPLIVAWSQAAAGGKAAATPSGGSINDLYARMDKLAPETQMFLADCPSELDSKYQRLECREIAIRNVLALSAGVQRTAYWQLLTMTLPRDNIMQLMYGKIGLLTYADGKVAKRYPTADAFKRTARFLAGVRQVKRIELPAKPAIYFFEIDRGDRGPAYVIWERRDTFAGEDQPATPLEVPWKPGQATARDVLGNIITTEVDGGNLRLPVSATPIFLEP
jgi:hypothetical protein